MKNPSDTLTLDLFGVSPGENDNAALVAQPAESGRGVSTFFCPGLRGGCASGAWVRNAPGASGVCLGASNFSLTSERRA